MALPTIIRLSLSSLAYLVHALVTKNGSYNIGPRWQQMGAKTCQALGVIGTIASAQRARLRFQEEEMQVGASLIKF
jgi:hypothetical protein